MKTLVELYDERPIENVLATEVFRPERTVFLCPAEVAQDRQLQEKLRSYFAHRGVKTELVFLESSMYYTAKVRKQLERVVKEYEDCTLDITGGTDAALFACGQLCAEADVPSFTYGRRNNRFYNIHRAEFADNLLCTVQHSVEDCFLMAGGSLHTGRVDNAVLERYMDKFDPFFRIYLRYRTQWTKIVKYVQQTSQTEKGAKAPLQVDAPETVKGDRGARISAPMDGLREREQIGFLKNVRSKDGKVHYTFADQQIRTWLRDIGSVLELYVYKACLDTGVFHEVRTSAVVDWQGKQKQGDVSNEIDVMAMQGILPAFISCKTCEVNTEALNELAILRDRFGGKGAKAAIVTSKNCRAITRHRAAELGIDVIDLEDLKTGRIGEHLKAMMRQD